MSFILLIKVIIIKVEYFGYVFKDLTLNSYTWGFASPCMFSRNIIIKFEKKSFMVERGTRRKVGARV